MEGQNNGRGQGSGSGSGRQRCFDYHGRTLTPYLRGFD
jgi:hypothetical protein